MLAAIAPNMIGCRASIEKKYPCQHRIREASVEGDCLGQHIAAPVRQVFLKILGLVVAKVEVLS